ncbi:DNA-processing protein DprA [Candidatus Shapirobacteria bacterium]|nr:DNA-processing protein DprA [Candidatus Shapirobacteria bacterium]
MTLDFKEISINEDRPYWVAFNVFQGIGPQKFLVILRYFGQARLAWKAREEEWWRLNLGEKLTRRFLDFRRHFSPEEYFEKLILGKLWQGEKFGFNNQEQEKDYSWVKRKGEYLREANKPVWPLTLADEFYPPLLKEIDSPPFLIYLKGRQSEVFEKKDFFSWPSLGVVGTRRITAYGRQVTSLLVQELAEAGLVIVSGLAWGVDSLAHQTALKRGGKTIAVLGCGIDMIYPPQAYQLSEEIAQKGLIISEFPAGMPPLPGNFPSRNRIIAGLSEGVLVTEGARQSGSLITASLAADFGREVFAVPGPITYPLCAGPLFLLKNGAKLVSSAEDVLEEFNLKGKKPLKKITSENLSPDEKIIIDFLWRENLTVDEIIKKAAWPAEKVNAVLGLLEIKGMAKNLGGGKWGRG